MKKTLFFLLFSGSLFAQNAELLNNDWYISQMTISNQTTTSPVMQLAIGTSKFMNSGNSYNFNSAYYNTAGSTITFSTTADSFTRQGGGCTLAIYNGTNAAAAQDYDQKNCDFFFNSVSGTVFNYQIINNGGTYKTLIITNPSTGNKIYYNNASFLGIKENNLQQSLLIYPNPVKEILTLENIENDLSVKVFNMIGQLVYEGKSADKKVKIDTQNFAVGQYILIVNGKKPYQFIKE
ncbi:hypothetical protein J3D55_002618 [Chryseobacterium ginsenosidimutans]|uniref:T9SS type A sorting domain-containing protein n=1 Tax=Chryseobacterium ginsenosidimutans TaxID=687846 RepID=UPI002167F2C3|nr:T9SS type A sorting domain-containing protein [Chryseobacterium ginsenosidimutans]MCS3869702.1 hypothetical protein [Chryseobacterium ginsenosidimutans]